MKLTKAILGKFNVRNPHNLCDFGEGKLLIYYRPQATGRAYQNAAWQVDGRGFQTDPQGYWRDNGNKTFNIFPQGEQTHNNAKEQQRLAAIAWTTERYKITEWIRDPFGCYQAKVVMDRAAVKIKQALIESPTATKE